MSADPTRAVPHLLRIERGQITETTLLAQPTATMGRQGDNTVVVRSKSASRYHARLHRENEGWTLTDLDSREGTMLNRRPIAQARLEHGDVIEIGRAGDVQLLYLERTDHHAVNSVLGNGPRPAPRPSPCPACGQLIERHRASAPLPPACPRCHIVFVAVPELDGGPSLVRTPFRLAMRGVVAAQPCLLREPMPAPPLPRVRTSGGTAPEPPPLLTARPWSSFAMRHAGRIVALAITPEGAVRAADSAQELRTWDPVTGAELERLRTPHPLIALSGDGRLALLADGDTPVVFDTSTGVEIWRTSPAGTALTCAAFDGSGRVAIGGHPNVVTCGPAAGSPRVETPAIPQLIAIALSRDGRRLVQVGHRVAIPGSPEHPSGDRLRYPDGVFYAFALAPGGEHAVLAITREDVQDVRARGAVSSLLLWQPFRDEPMCWRIQYCQSLPTAISLSSDGGTVLWGDTDGGVHSMDTAEQRLLETNRLHDRAVTAVARDEERRLAVSGGEDGRVRLLIPPDSSAPDPHPPGPSGGTIALAVSRAGRLVSAGLDGLLRAWDASTGARQSESPHVAAPGARLALDATGEVALIGDRTGVTARNAADGRWLWTRPGSGREISPALGFLESTGTVLIGQGTFVTELDRRRGLLLREIPIPLRLSRVIGFRHRGRDAVVIAGNQIWSVHLEHARPTVNYALPTAGTSPTVLLSHDGDDALFLRPDGATWLDLSRGETWALDTGERLSAAAVSPGGRRVALAFETLGLTLWDPRADRLVARWYPTGRLGPFDRQLLTLAFSPDGNLLHAGTREGPLLAFDVP